MISQVDQLVADLRQYCRSVGVDYDAVSAAAAMRLEGEPLHCELTEQQIEEVAEDVFETTKDIET